MNKQNPLKFKNHGGFTMIELLIVLSIIGLLIVAMTTNFNPVNLIKKGRDAKNQADLEDVIRAFKRYWTEHQEYPFAEPTSPVGGIVADGYTIGICGDPDCNSNGPLITEGELKPAIKNTRLFEAEVEEPPHYEGLVLVNFKCDTPNATFCNPDGEEISPMFCYIPRSENTRQDLTKLWWLTNAGGSPWLNNNTIKGVFPCDNLSAGEKATLWSNDNNACWTCM